MTLNVSKSVFEMQLGIMKNTLKLFEFRFGGRDSEQFRYLKEQLMNYTYDGLRRFFQQGVDEGSFESCSCGANLRHGWASCQWCSGSGYKDTKIK